MDSALNDKRFANIGKDPRFRRVPASTRKVVVDKRFNAMFNDRKFKLKYTVDKRGKPSTLTSSEQLKNYYEIESDESEKEDDEDESNDDADTEDNENESSEKYKDEDNDTSEEPGKLKETLKSSKSTLKKSTIATSGFIVSDIKPNTEEPEVELDDVVKAKLQDLNVDYARGEGLLFSDSSSSEEESSEEDDQEVFHDWGELDKDAEETDTATYRLAVCNMDWDRIRAVDLMVVMQSFSPQGGRVKAVNIYPSEFGLERMKEEEILGPKELIEMKQETDTSVEVKNESDEIDDYHREKLRQYQINRLKYYYAVVECDSAETANKIYEECDGQEFESSAARLDLRFIPDDMTFDQKPKDVCNTMPDVSQYEPRLFLTSALQQANVHLTWDETDPSRMQTMQKLFKGKNGKQQIDIDDEQIKNFLATSSEEEEDEEVQTFNRNIPEEDEADGTESCMGENERIAKYRNLLASIAQSEESSKKNKGEVEMEISWGVGLQSKAEEMVKKKMAEKALETPWEQQLAKRREKRKAQKQEKKQLEVAPPSDEEESDDIPSDIDMNDPYFKEEFDKKEFRKKPKANKKTAEEKQFDDEQDKAAQLDLLLMDEDDGKRHFNLKSIIKEETKAGKKGKKKTSETTKTKDDDFKIQVDDPRFAALFTSHHFNLDPSDSNFKKTEAMETILQEKQKRRKDEPNAELALEQPVAKVSRVDPELSRLVRSVKAKTSMQNNQRKFKS